MKHHLGHLIDIAKLRNKKNSIMPSAGNEFSYFSKEGYSGSKLSGHLQVPQDSIRMAKVVYKPKLELYASLRVK